MRTIKNALANLVQTAILNCKMAPNPAEEEKNSDKHKQIHLCEMP